MTRDGVRRWLTSRLALLLVLVAAASSLAAGASLHWVLELFSHFTPHGAAAGFILALAFLALRSPRWAGAAAVVAAANIALAAQNFVPPKTPDASASGTRLGILFFNVGNADAKSVVDYVLARADRVDVVILIEARTDWAPELKRLEKTYPHSVRELKDSPWGLAAFSKIEPLENRIIERWHGGRLSETRIKIAGRNRPVAVYGVHPPPPIARALAEMRNGDLDTLARRIRDRSEETAIVGGDFNLTPSSPYFPAFARASGLAPARSAWLARSTWPGMVASARLGIPIDHAFVAPETGVVAYETGPYLGSDHLPVTVILALP